MSINRDHARLMRRATAAALATAILLALSKAVAEQLYYALSVWKSQSSLTITPISLPFFQTFNSAVQPGTYASSTSTFASLTSAIGTFADGFLAIHAKYTPANGGLAEQFSRSNGSPLSAVDLTWSYAAALTGFAARNGTAVASWGAAGLTVPASCQGNTGPTVSVTFNVQATTVWGGASSVCDAWCLSFMLPSAGA